MAQSILKVNVIVSAAETTGALLTNRESFLELLVSFPGGDEILNIFKTDIADFDDFLEVYVLHFRNWNDISFLYTLAEKINRVHKRHGIKVHVEKSQSGNKNSFPWIYNWELIVD